MNELELQFHKAMLEGYEQLKRECHYNATYFLSMVVEIGGVATAHHLLTTDNPSAGFTRLWECGRLDLSVEAFVLEPEYRSLFSDEERDIARERLAQYGYDIDNKNVG